MSLRDARATFWPCASYVRPLSLRGKAPPMKSLYVFRTGSRSGIAHHDVDIARNTRCRAGSGEGLARAPRYPAEPMGIFRRHEQSGDTKPHEETTRKKDRFVIKTGRD